MPFLHFAWIGGKLHLVEPIGTNFGTKGGLAISTELQGDVVVPFFFLGETFNGVPKLFTPFPEVTFVQVLCSTFSPMLVHQITECCGPFLSWSFSMASYAASRGKPGRILGILPLGMCFFIAFCSNLFNACSIFYTFSAGRNLILSSMKSLYDIQSVLLKFTNVLLSDATLRVSVQMLTTMVLWSELRAVSTSQLVLTARIAWPW